MLVPFIQYLWRHVSFGSNSSIVTNVNCIGTLLVCNCQSKIGNHAGTIDVNQNVLRL